VRRKVPGLFAFAAPDFARERMRSRLLFLQLGCGKETPPRVPLGTLDARRGGYEFISL